MKFLSCNLYILLLSLLITIEKILQGIIGEGNYLIDENIHSFCYRERLRNEMWNANDDNEWRPKLEYARLRLKLKEHAPGFIIFKGNWPGKMRYLPV